MTAVSLTRSLYAHNPRLNITVVEARDLCSGATGYNGGHCKVMSPGVWFERDRAYVTAEALRVMRFENSHLDELVQASRENGIQCDLRLHEGLDVYHDEHNFERAMRALEAMRGQAPDLAARYTVYTEGSDLGGRSCPKSTVVKAVEKSDEVATVKTTRGNMSAPIVVHATNAWMSHLVPELRPFVSPVRANVQRKVVVDSGIHLDASLWLRHAEHVYDYMVQRHDGAFIIGRANTGHRATSDDANMDLLTQTHLRAVVPGLFDFGTKNVQTTHAWSGCVAFTQDGNPFIGKRPGQGRGHQWICGTYQGIGMVRAFRSAQVLALMILGKDVPEEFPRSMVITEERLRGLERSVKAKL